MICRVILLLWLSCLGSFSRATRQLNDVSKRDQTTLTAATYVQPYRVIDRSDDQQTSSAVITSVRITDNSGRLKKVKLSKLSSKRKKPRKSSKLRKNKGLRAKQRLRKRKKKNKKLSAQTLLPTTPVGTDIIYEYEYEDEYEYDDYDDYFALQDDVIIPVFGPDDHDQNQGVPVLIHDNHHPNSYGHRKPHPPHNSYHKNKHHNKKPGYSHVSVETPSYRYNIEHYGESHNSYGPHKQHKGGYGHHIKDSDYSSRPKFGYPKEKYHEKHHYTPQKPQYPPPPYHPAPVQHGYPHHEEVYLKPYAPQPKPYYIQDPYHHYHPDPYPLQEHHYPTPLPPIFHKIPPPRHEAVVVHQEADPFYHRLGPRYPAQPQSYHRQVPVHHVHHTLNEVLVPLPPSVVEGRAYGADLVGNFDHHTGSFGPSGFYANYYDEK